MAFGCATTQVPSPQAPLSHVSSSSFPSSSARFGFKAEAVAEGISITFNNIPADTDRLFIYFFESRSVRYSPYDEIARTYDYSHAVTDIMGSALEHTKKTGNVIVPFVKPGRKYLIEAAFVTKAEADVFVTGDNREGLLPIDWSTRFVKAECVPYAGIYNIRDIEVDLDETHTVVTLSSEPVFSAKVDYAPVKYRYTSEIDFDDEAVAAMSTIDWEDPANNIAYDEVTNELSHDFSPLYSLWKKNGVDINHPAYVAAYCNIMYGDLLWEIDIAKSEYFTLSF